MTPSYSLAYHPIVRNLAVGTGGKAQDCDRGDRRFGPEARYLSAKDRKRSEKKAVPRLVWAGEGPLTDRRRSQATGGREGRLLAAYRTCGQQKIVEP